MRYKAVLFDLDGTLLDTLEDLGNAVNRVLAKRGFPPHSIESYRHFIGDGAALLISRALPEERRDDESIQSCLEEFRRDYSRSWRVKTKAYDGVTEMLKSLKARGLKMAILSNKPDDFTKRSVKALLPHRVFRAVLGEREGIPRKPHPAGALEVAERLRVPPRDFLYLGDSSVDMKTAIAAGMTPIGVLWGFRSAKELLDGGAHRLIERPEEVISLLG
ncbi:MAG: HAD-IA family hydrolase [Proteobacteria bacterium]|nr:HAD-IA family hydrolase [Pseudomonadota bacterium]